uniref:Uncharacterized protein n=1 Tax=Ixodes scapularis TaxID=6945 RepID=A0A4D5S2J2_IXOSC
MPLAGGLSAAPSGSAMPGDAGPAAATTGAPFALVVVWPLVKHSPKYADVELHCSRRIPEDRKEPFVVICSRRERCPSFSRSSILAARPNCTIGLTSTQWILHVARKNSARCSSPRRVPEVSETLRWFFFFPFSSLTPPRRCLVEPS